LAGRPAGRPWRPRWTRAADRPRHGALTYRGWIGKPPSASKRGIRRGRRRRHQAGLEPGPGPDDKGRAPSCPSWLGALGRSVDARATLRGRTLSAHERAQRRRGRRGGGIIYRGRSERHSETCLAVTDAGLGSVLAVAQALEERATGQRAGWKIGAAAGDSVGRGRPQPSPGRIYRHTVFESPGELPQSCSSPTANCECEFPSSCRRLPGPGQAVHRG